MNGLQPGDIKYDENGQFWEFLGGVSGWRLVTPAERDKAAWEASRHGTPDRFAEARRRALGQ